MFTSLMSKGIYCSASNLIDSSSSSSVIAGRIIFLTITECPETENATALVLSFCSSTKPLMISTTLPESITVPSTMRSLSIGAIPSFSREYPFLPCLSCRSLILLDPMSSPTRAICFLLNPNIISDLYSRLNFLSVDNLLNFNHVLGGVGSPVAPVPSDIGNHSFFFPSKEGRFGNIKHLANLNGLISLFKGSVFGLVSQIEPLHERKYSRFSKKRAG